MKFSILACLSSLLLFVSAFAQTPEETAEAYFEALSQKDYEAMAGFMATDSLTEFRSFFDVLMEMDADDSEMMMQQFLGEDVTPENIILLSDEEFFAKFMDHVMGQAAQLMNLSFEEQTIIGKVAEGDELMHVLARFKMKMGESDMEQVEVVTMKKQGDSWKLTLSGDIKGMAEGIKQSAQMMKNMQ